MQPATGLPQRSVHCVLVRSASAETPPSKHERGMFTPPQPKALGLQGSSEVELNVVVFVTEVAPEVGIDPVP